MCKAFGFAPGDFADMEWTTFLGWLKARRRLEQGAEPSPDSWAVPDPWFSAEAKAERARSGRLT